MQSHQITHEQLARVKELFLLSGKTYTVLNGRSLCVRGEAHKVAVLLGLKPKISDSLDHVLRSSQPTN